jgi:hypothetical protein
MFHCDARSHRCSEREDKAAPTTPPSPSSSPSLSVVLFSPCLYPTDARDHRHGCRPMPPFEASSSEAKMSTSSAGSSSSSPSKESAPLASNQCRRCRLPCSRPELRRPDSPPPDLPRRHRTLLRAQGELLHPSPVLPLLRVPALPSESAGQCPEPAGMTCSA